MSPPRAKPHRKYNYFSDKAWNACMESFLSSLGTAKSRRAYEPHLKALFRDRSRSPAGYSRQEIEAFINRPTKRGKPPMPRGYNMRLMVIQSFYNYAIKYPFGNGYLMKRASPTTGIKYREAAETERTFEEEEIVRLFAAIPRDTVLGLRSYALFLTLFLTARRDSEIREMKWGDISVGIDGVAYYKWTGKGLYGTYKRAELPQEALEAIKDYLRIDGRLESIKSEHYIFKAQGELQNRPVDHYTMNEVIRRHLRQAGIQAGSAHWLRHTSAYLRSLDGADLHEIMLLLGHKSPATTVLYLEKWKKPKRDTRASKLALLVR